MGPGYFPSRAIPLSIMFLSSPSPNPQVTLADQVLRSKNGLSMQLSMKYLDILLLMGRKDSCVSWCLASIVRPVGEEFWVVMKWSRKQR